MAINVIYITRNTYISLLSYYADVTVILKLVIVKKIKIKEEV